MSYQVLARKWRPKNFHELIGQDHVQRALVHALDQQRLHHAYLFTGTRGVGKTSIARIFAKCLNCEQGVSSQPCGQCSACVAVTENRFVDLIEIDAASNTGVDSIRELTDNAQYMPTQGRFKIYLIDEVHMLSTAAFNALLKTLEEPPEHVKFLLATTDPQKVPVTVLSRCLQFSLKNMSAENIAGHLKAIFEQEMIPFDVEALWLLAEAGKGSMRDALSLADQAIGFTGDQINAADVSAMLGLTDRKALLSLLNAIAHGDAPRVLEVVGFLSETVADFAAVLDNLIALLHRIAIEQALPNGAGRTEDTSLQNNEAFIELAQLISSSDCQLFYQLALQGQRDLPYANDTRSGFEMTLLRMLAFRPQGLFDLPEEALSGSLKNQAGRIAHSEVTSRSESLLEQPPQESSPSNTLVPSHGNSESPRPATNTDPELAISPVSDSQSTLEDSLNTKDRSELDNSPERNNRHEHADSAGQDEACNSVRAASDSRSKDRAVSGSLQHRETNTASSGDSSANQQLPPIDKPPWLEEAKSGADFTNTVSKRTSDVQDIASHSDASVELPSQRTPSHTQALQDKKVVPLSSVASQATSQDSNVSREDSAEPALPPLTPAYWPQILTSLKLKGVINSTLMNAVIANIEREESQQHIVLLVDQSKSSLMTKRDAETLAKSLSALYGKPIRASIKAGELGAKQLTPAKLKQMATEQALSDAENQFRSDPVVQELERELGAMLHSKNIVLTGRG